MLAAVFRRVLQRGILATSRRVAMAPPASAPRPRPRFFSTTHAPQGHGPPVQPMGVGPQVNTTTSVGKPSHGEVVRRYMGFHSKFFGGVILYLVGADVAFAVDEDRREQLKKKAMDGSTMDTSASSCP